jgi:hypothetical protein
MPDHSIAALQQLLLPVLLLQLVLLLLCSPAATRDDVILPHYQTQPKNVIDYPRILSIVC